jgi:hypothetical protein
VNEGPVWIEVGGGSYWAVKAEWDGEISVHNTEDEARAACFELNKAYKKGREHEAAAAVHRRGR